MYLCAEARRRHWASSISAYSFEAGSLSALGTHVFLRLGWKPTSLSISGSAPLEQVIQGFSRMPSLLSVWWGFELQASVIAELLSPLCTGIFTLYCHFRLGIKG